MFGGRATWTRRGVLAGAAALPAVASCRAADERARRDELLAGLEDRSASVAPIAEPERRPRRARLGEALAAAGFQALFCEGGATMTWLAGVAWGRSERTFGLLVFADGSHGWICPAFEAGKARLQIEGDGRPGGELRTWDEHEYAFEPLASLLRERRVERLALDGEVRWFVADRLGGTFGRERLASGAPLVAALRSVKEPRELELLRRANELTKAALVEVARHVRAGWTTAEIAALVDRAQERLGLRRPWNLTLLGAAAAYPHGDTSAQELQRGDFVLVDTGGTLHDYQSDITRTWVGEGAPRERELRAWHSVRTAQRRAFEAIRPGAQCRSVDAAARASLAADGWGDGYSALTHRLGHGIGLEGHEEPYFDGGSDTVLQPGMTLSNEPGIYVPGEFGVRIEDIVAVAEGGAEVFGAWQESPLAPG